MKNDLSELNLKGKVKSSTDISYKMKNLSGEIRRNLDTYLKRIILFNENGNIIEKCYYKLFESFFKGPNLNDNLYKETKYTYKYDKENLKVKESIFAIKHETDEILINESTYEYNDNGNMIGEYSYNKDTLSEYYNYEYDNKGNLIKKCLYDSYNSLCEKSIYGYIDNKTGTLLKSIDLNENINIIEECFCYSPRYYRVYVCEYDYKWNKHNECYYNSDETLEIEINHYYDSNGVEISKEHVEVEINPIHINYKYEYDKNSNWRKKTELIDNIPQEITEREIEYYE